MDIDKIFQKLQEKALKNKTYFKNLSNENKQEIKEKEELLSKKVKILLDKKGIDISDINTSFHQNFTTKDEEVMNAYITVYTSSFSQKASAIVTNAETMEMLYIRTSVTKFISIKDFFNIE